MTAEGIRADPATAGARVVSVAVDAAGAAGQRPFSYRVPGELSDLAAGEAVLVEFGRRQALAIVLGPGAEVEGIDTKPVLDRIRADGPLLPELSMRLGAWISDHYLAPPAITLRAMLPPGMLERLELVAELRPAGEGDGSGPADAVAARGANGGSSAGGLSADDQAIVAALETGPRQVRQLDAPEGRPALLRRLRSLEASGRLDLDWTLLAAAAGPRWVRFARLAGEGRDGAASMRRLGPRQQAVLEELATAPADGIAAPELAARHGGSTLSSLVRRGLVEIDVREAPRQPLAHRLAGARGARPAGAQLSPEQVEAVQAVDRAAAAQEAKVILLDGVTGGGKTAIYAELLALALARGRPALVLVPEIALALPLVDRLRAELDARVALLHSGLGDGERADEWRRIRRGDADVVVGTRMAVLAPLADVGLIVVDEEHDPAYKSDRTPRLQARDAAIELGRLAGAPVVLGSATPSVETEGRARSGEIQRFRLPIRLSGAPPAVEVVDLRAELAAGNVGMLSRSLASALTGLADGEQAILVINRRGTASVVLCRDCGHVATCPDCTRPLVYHQAGGTLRCHHCGRAWPMPSRCPSCGSARIRYLGGGTERVEREVRDRFPALRIGRLDRDVVERKGAAERVIDAFTDRRLDVLVGTSLVTKGLDIPAVTLVGIVSADVALNLPDERAAERTYQLLAQAVGRAGRGDRPGTAIIQTYQPEHPAIVAVAEGRAEAFYDAELDMRRRFGSPPFGKLVKLTVAQTDRGEAETAGRELATRLRERAAESGVRVDVAGPAPAFVARRGDRWRFNVVLRGEDPVALLGDPPGAPWSIDVDPESLL
ncbi:MAG TPA: primosomal protein N' [Patescibacteria group bacterium]|nr:primosomal protein N' [Patescibacteria group bacterium]